MKGNKKIIVESLDIIRIEMGKIFYKSFLKSIMPKMALTRNQEIEILLAYRESEYKLIEMLSTTLMLDLSTRDKDTLLEIDLILILFNLIFNGEFGICSLVLLEPYMSSLTDKEKREIDKLYQSITDELILVVEDKLIILYESFL